MWAFSLSERGQKWKGTGQGCGVGNDAEADGIRGSGVGWALRPKGPKVQNERTILLRLVRLTKGSLRKEVGSGPWLRGLTKICKDCPGTTLSPGKK